jgi:hypothetical protein
VEAEEATRPGAGEEAGGDTPSDAGEQAGEVEETEAPDEAGASDAPAEDKTT